MLFFAYDTTTILKNAFSLNGAIPSAVQVTQVYSEASFYGIIAIACFAFAVLMAISVVGTFLSQLVLIQLEQEDERQAANVQSEQFSAARKRE